MTPPLIKPWRLLPGRRIRILILAGAVALLALVLAATPGMTAQGQPAINSVLFRHDLYRLIHQRICAEPPASAHLMAQLSTLITARSFDAGARLMSVQWSARQPGQSSPETQMIAMAQQAYHHGGAWGECDLPAARWPESIGGSPPWLRRSHPLPAAQPPRPRYGWIITTPSPYAASHPHLASALKTQCHHLELLALAESGSTSPRKITYQTWQQLITQPTLDHTQYKSVSLRCLPRRPAWLGPVMWFLRHQSPPPSSPTTTIANPGAFITTLHHLINQNRASMGLAHLQLPPPALHHALQDIVTRLSRHSGLTHHHHELQQLTSQLTQTWGDDYGLTSLAELRVLAADPHGAYAQLITSPSHHRAIMHPRGQWLVSHQVQPTGPAQPPLTTLIIVHQRLDNP